MDFYSYINNLALSHFLKMFMICHRLRHSIVKTPLVDNWAVKIYFLLTNNSALNILLYASLSIGVNASLHIYIIFYAEIF